MQDFRELVVWQKAHRFVLMIYEATNHFPADERFGLTNQIRRASVSITSNIAEGCGRDTSAELLRFSQIAMGSASEVEYQLLLSHDLGFINEADYSALNSDLIEVKRMLNGFIRTLKQRR